MNTESTAALFPLEFLDMLADLVPPRLVFSRVLPKIKAVLNLPGAPSYAQRPDQ